ncbi:MAG TPA: hypothetical protein VK737_06215 [Opitutales bacterium]|jgi:hypothetical protein|nr:hypothetical protein [Opitutales bacterium]
MRSGTKIILAAFVVTVAAAVPLAMQWSKISQLNAQIAQARSKVKVSALKKISGTAASANNMSDLALILAIPDRLERLRSLIDFAGQMDAANLRGALEALGKLHADTDTMLAMSILTARLVELDPHGALAWAKTLPKTGGQQMILETLFNSWSSADPAAALKAISEFADVSLRNSLLSTTLTNLAARDPVAALEYLGKLPPGQQSTSLLKAVFTTWASTDPQAAATAALAMPASKNRITAVEDMLQGWAEIDPQGALTWAAALPPGSIRASALTAALSNLAQQDPKAAVDYVGKIPRAQDRNQLMTDVATAWAVNDPAAALAWVDEFPSTPAHDTAISDILQHLSQNDPVTAAADLSQIDNQSVRERTMAQIAATWEQVDLPAALEWSLAQRTSGRIAMDMTDTIMHDWALEDPAATAQYIANLKDQPNYTKYLGSVMANWMSADAPSALAWAQSLPDQIGHDEVMITYTIQSTNTDPVAAWNAAQTIDLSPTNKNYTMTNVITKWAALDPASAAANLTNTLSDNPDMLNTAITEISKNWIQQDQTAASQWIDTLPASPARDGAVAQLVTVALQKDPSSALNWAATIGNDNQRADQINRVVTQWARTDPTAATAAVQNADVTDQQRQNMLSTIQRLSKVTPAK